ncbi:hypothetical protein HPP92_012481 [Vanilla planifolia]|uniref:GRAM domain-containing protein n=1 Tax=Vanilla planifolia TaxID=51239 RepID=A0A835R1M6_VANPL|nr:hypothetical protein HPP92_012481 [Vanilla planifolia]
MNKFSKKADCYARGIKSHVCLGTNLPQTVKGREKLLNAFQCYLSTTAGPIAGALFISTKKIAFHSDRSIKLTSAREEIARIPYKVVIPLRRMKSQSM